MTRKYITPDLFGPQAEQLRLFLDQVDEAPAERWLEALPAAWDAARDAAWDAARDAAAAAAAAAAALVVRDLISTEHYVELTRVMRVSGFVVHPDDGPLP